MSNNNGTARPLDLLYEERDAIESELHDAERALQEATRRIKHYQAESAVIRRIIERFEEQGMTTADPAPRKSQSGATAAIISLVKEKPGLPLKEIVEQVSGEISTDAKDPIRSTYNVGSGLVAKGRLIRDNDGGIWLPGQREDLPFRHNGTHSS